MPSYGFSGKGGFGSWTKTGRNIQLGRSLGESMARQSSKSSSSEGDSYCASFICILLVLLLIDTITKVKNIQLQ
jgi:hypothetical protein